MSKIKHKLRIHGDNILECESALKLLATALNGGSFELKIGPAYAPIYQLKSDTGEVFEIQLFPGYGRWNFPLEKYIESLGGILREAPDAIVTTVKFEHDGIYEKPIIAFEFSGALPAGNNAWQRTGRALALAYAGIPYLYFAELGGQELDASRKIKAARFPNPLVPFAYAVLGSVSNSISLPVYIPSPSSNQKVLEVFKGCFGSEDSIDLVRNILLSEDVTNSREKIENKVLRTVGILSLERKRADVLRAAEWTELYAQKSGIGKVNWLIKKAMPWNKKTGIKTLTPSFNKLLNAVNSSGVVAIGSKEMPICIIPNKQRKLFASKVQSIYKERVDADFLGWLTNQDRPLVCVWVAGFKPRGDDSRPDRGLVPLARMMFGVQNVDLLTIVYGPAKPSTWAMLTHDMKKLASINGLWETIVKLGNAIIVDSSTSSSLKKLGFLTDQEASGSVKKLLPAANDVPNFGEHDVDSVIHLMFSHGMPKMGVYESMCNPPGGDWSGINLLGPENKLEFRWTSLPRVSGSTSKRPDHLIQFLNDRILFSVESKDSESTLEPGIGPRLVKYVGDLLNKSPIAVRNYGEREWLQYRGLKIKEFKLLSGAAFRYQNLENLKMALSKGRVNVVFGVEFIPKDKKTIFHILTNREGDRLVPIIKKLAADLSGFIEIKVY